MPDEPEEDQEPKQHTPQGAEIPIPTKEEVLRDLAKVAKPSRPRRNGGSEK
jgi:hypothetical protein